jgi:CheY-like chemotaxis protein
MMDRSILLVEDDPAIAQIIVEMLEGADYAVDGPHMTLSDGLEALARKMPSGAVLDIRLKKGDVGLLADDLDLYDIPYVFCSGSFDHPAVAGHPSAPLIPKPAMGKRLIPTLRRMLH